jgi:hypothetical protein
VNQRPREHAVQGRRHARLRAAARRIVTASRNWYTASGGDGAALAEHLDAALAADASEPDADRIDRVPPG